MKRISALYVLTDGPYFGLKNVDPWDIHRDAKKYKGPHRVIAHPPCERWGRYWSGGPMLAGTRKRKKLGDDNGCFAHALWSVRTFGGLLEHPEASHAWKWFGMKSPPRYGGWIDADEYGGKTCCVAQGNYGHSAQKLTWIYSVGVPIINLKWGLTPGMNRLDEGFHSKEERSKSNKKITGRLSKKQNTETPIKFRNLLLRIARG